MNTNRKTLIRARRHNRIRAKVAGTHLRPRLAIYKSNRFMEAQVIDDASHKTLCSVKMDDASKVGSEIAKKAKEIGVAKVVFDRGGFSYTGRVAQLAEAARKGGLEF